MNLWFLSLYEKGSTKGVLTAFHEEEKRAGEAVKGIQSQMLALLHILLIIK